MRAAVIRQPIHPAERDYLRRLAAAGSTFVLVRNTTEKLKACALVQAGYAVVHPIFPDKFKISPTGRIYLDRLVRAH